MTTRPFISCIVPVFNGERYLAYALDSIFAQTLPPDEVIVVNDGSIDGTERVLAGYRDRVRVLSGPNQGSGPARNRGIAAANGDLLAFLDADDLWLPVKLERQVERFAARPELEVSVTMVRNFWIPELADEAAKHLGKRYSQALPGYGGQALMVRRSVFDRIGGFGEIRISHDTEWFARAFDSGVIIEMIPDVLVLRRLHHHNLSHAEPERIPDEILMILKARLDRRRTSGTTEPPSS